MRRRSIVLLLICVFVAGVFFGIWADWRVMKKRYSHQNLIYQVQNYPTANLAVYPGDKITLVPPHGGSGDDLQMNFVGYNNPCEDTNPLNPCVIKQTAGIGPYFFTCSSVKYGYTCPDPGIQQTPTIPFQFGILKTELIDIVSLAGVNLAPPAPVPAPVAGGHTPPASTAATAYVSCDPGTNKTVLRDLNNNPFPSDTITANKNQTVFWISSQPFTLSSTTAGLCSNSDFPPSGSTQETQCDVNLSGQTVSYVVQAQITPTACAATTDAQLKIN